MCENTKQHRSADRRIQFARANNPAVDAFEKRIAAREGGVAAVATSSAQAARTLAILNLAEAGNNIVASQSLYTGSVALFIHTLPRLGIKTRFSDFHDHRAVVAAIDNNTRAIYTETVGNPAVDVRNLRALATLAHDFNLPLVVDNSFAPALSRPIDHGAHVVVHNATQWITEHGTSIGGVIVDAGTFNWGATARFRNFYGEPETAYYGVRFAEAFGNVDGANIAFSARLRLLLLPAIGASVSPSDASQFLKGLDTADVIRATTTEPQRTGTAA